MIKTYYHNLLGPATFQPYNGQVPLFWLDGIRMSVNDWVNAVRGFSGAPSDEELLMIKLCYSR
jgi:hypothetical protein